MRVTDTPRSALKYFDLPALPGSRTLLLKAATTLMKKLHPDARAARLAARVKGVVINRAWVCEYNAVCGFKEDGISLTAPQVLAAPLHLYLLGQPEQPMPILGLVHLRNLIECSKALAYDVPYDVLVTIGDTRRISPGLEFDVHTRFLVGEEVHWKSTMTVLSRVKNMPERLENKNAPTPVLVDSLSALDAQCVVVNVPENQGRKYAKVSNDYNPIHLHACTARIFGFKHAIAHGMWTAAKTLGIVEASLGARASKFDLSFKQPVFLPSNIVVKHAVCAGGDSSFEVLAERDSKVLMVGSIAS